MKKKLVLKNKKRINRDMKDVKIATWLWRSHRGHVAKRRKWKLSVKRKTRKFRRCNLKKAFHLDILIALKNFERGNT